MKQVKIIFIAMASLFFMSGAIAQMNESDTAKFQWRSTLAGNYQTGNVEVLVIRGKVDFTYTPVKNVVFKSQNSSLYQEFYGNTADNDLFSRNYFYYKPQHKIYPYAIAYISTNYRRKVELRSFAGAGVTWQLLQTKNHVIKLSTNAVYEQTRFKGTTFNFSEYDGDHKINLWRASTYIGGWNWIFHNQLRFFYDAYWQPAFNNSNNYRTQLDLGVDFPVWKGLSFTAAYAYTHENIVINQIKQTDSILTFGLSYSLKIKQP